MGRLAMWKIASIASIFTCGDKMGRNREPMMLNAQSVNLQSQTVESVTQKKENRISTKRFR